MICTPRLEIQLLVQTPLIYNPPNHEQDDIQEYVPTNHPPTLEISKNSRGAPVEQTTVPNEEILTENAENESDAIDIQHDLQPNPTIETEKSPDNTNENQGTTLSEYNDGFRKEILPTNTGCEKKIIYDLSQKLTSRTQIDIKNRRLLGLNFLPLASIQNPINSNKYRNKKV